MARLPRNISTKILQQLDTTITNAYDSDFDARVKIRRIREMLSQDAVTSLAYETLCMLIISMIGEFHHDNEEIMDECNSSIALMRGSFTEILQDACSYLPYGFSYAQIVYRVYQGKAALIDIDFLDQERMRFEGTTRDIKPFYRGQETDVELKYSQGLHLTNQSNISPSARPTGYRLGDRALPDWDLYKLMFGSYAVVTQKQATKLLVGKTDTEAEVDTGLMDANGNPILAPGNQLMMEALEGAENSSVLVVDTNDEVDVVDQTSDGKFFMEGFTRGDSNRFRCFYLPQTSYGGNQSGVGDAGLAETQHQMLLNIAASKAAYITTEFTEQVFRPMIEFNHGAQPNYGGFRINTQDPKAIELAKIVADLIKTDSEIIANEKDALFARLKGLLGVA